MEVLDEKYHIISDGILNREDYALLFENEEKKHIIPVEVTHPINIYSNATLAANVLHQMSKKQIKVAFFNPSKDVVNACISFGNTFLYNEFLNIIWTKGLDLAIGMVHSTNRRNYSLNLDFEDIFKPVITDRVIFSLLNRKMLGTEHFEQQGEGTFLSKTGKVIFLEMYERKLEKPFVLKEKH